jgi:hypothetical protein
MQVTVPASLNYPQKDFTLIRSLILNEQKID